MKKIENQEKNAIIETWHSDGDELFLLNKIRSLTDRELLEAILMRNYEIQNNIFEIDDTEFFEIVKTRRISLRWLLKTKII